MGNKCPKPPTSHQSNLTLTPRFHQGQDSYMFSEYPSQNISNISATSRAHTTIHRYMGESFVCSKSILQYAFIYIYIYIHTDARMHMYINTNIDMILYYTEYTVMLQMVEAIWQWVKTLAPSAHQNRWDLWMFIHTHMVP